MRLWPRRRRICYARSPMPEGFWCMRSDRHRDDEHEATFSSEGLTPHDLPPATVMRDGKLVLRWAGDHPYDPVESWRPFMELFSAHLWGARERARHGRDLTPAENDAVWARARRSVTP